MGLEFTKLSADLQNVHLQGVNYLPEDCDIQHDRERHLMTLIDILMTNSRRPEVPAEASGRSSYYEFMNLIQRCKVCFLIVRSWLLTLP